jgi:hypothetical protein
VTRFAEGSRVLVVGDHPWSGHAGVITGPFAVPSAPDLKWRVTLDIGADAAVSERDIRPVRGSHGVRAEKYLGM